MALADLNVYRVTDIETAEEFLRWLGGRRPILAVDTETTGLSYWTENFVRLAQFGDAETGWAISAKRWWGLIEMALQRYQGDIVFQNVPFDMHALESDGLPIPDWRRVHDTLPMTHLLDNGKAVGLKPTAARLFGQEARAGQGLLKKLMQKTKTTWATVSEDAPEYWAYGALDTVLTARVFEHQYPLIQATYQEQYDLEMEVIRILYGAENRGMLVDNDYTSTLLAKWNIEVEALYASLKEYGITSPHARAQIEAALQAKDPEWEPEEWTGTGLTKLDKSVLLRLGGDIGPAVLRLRRLLKWKKVYLEGFLNNQDSAGRLHPNIKTLGARTGRMSIDGAAGPLQTLPRGPEVRNCIIPSPKHSLVSVDFDSQEFRLFAHYAGATAIADAIERDVDLHAWAASIAYGVDIADVSKSQRQIAKNVNYARIYGAQAARIAETASAPDTNGSYTIVSPAEVQKFLDAFDAEVPEVSLFLGQVEVLAKNRLAKEGRAYVTSVGGRRLVGDTDKLYALVNYLVQGTAADILKKKIVELSNAGYEDHILLPVHDEVIFEIPTKDYDDLAPDFERIMRDDTFSVPLSVSSSPPMDRWEGK